MNVSIHAGDNRVTLRRLIDSGVRVHSVVTDPPYGLVSVQKRFGKEGSAAARTEGNDGSFGRLSAGFMGKAWDGTGIERDPEFWKLIYDVLLPGGCVFAFSGSRTGHWQACAMEMAGFIMHPMHGWTFGSGFPKAHNAGHAIDKMLGQGKGSRGEGQRDTLNAMGDGLRNRCSECGLPFFSANACKCPKPKPVTDEGLQWEGWAYGTQTQKPALEPIYLGQKPFSEKTGAANLLKHGVGAFNIDGCRVPTSEDETIERGDLAATYTDAHEGYQRTGHSMMTHKPKERGGPANATGRHPANLLHDGSPEVVALFPDSKGQQGDVRGTEPSGVTKEIYGKFNARVPSPVRGDSGSAARFFNSFPLTEDDLGEVQPFFYHPKAGKQDRAGSKHPTVKPIALMQHLIRHITPLGGVVLDPFAGSGTTGEAALREGVDCILMEAEPEYLEFLERRFGKPFDQVTADLW